MTNAHSIDTSVSKQTKKRKTVTTSVFIGRARATHGDRFCYDKTLYKSCREKLIITCKEHGGFTTLPAKHMGKSGGCRACALENHHSRMNTEQFIEKAKRVHNGFYSYENSVYLKSSKKVNITCPIHGSFWQAANGHIEGKGCADCSGNAAGSKQSFIKKAMAKHSGLYSYSKVEYVKSSVKVVITCPVHGDFEQRPADHLTGRGCKKCGIAKSRGNSRSNTGDFIDKAALIHGNKYTYDKVVYKTAIRGVVITCKKHGDFEQTPNRHLVGGGCSKCWRESVVLANSKSSDRFFQEVSLMHGTKYDYSKAVYKGSEAKIKVKCYEHGYFLQQANAHLRGANCPQCSLLSSGFGRSNFELACAKNNGVGFLYVIKCYKDGECFYKIGITSNSVGQRFKSATAMPYDYDVISLVSDSYDFIFDMERSLHRLLKNNTHAPLVAFDGMTECFSTIKPIESLLKRLSKTKQLQLIT